MNQLPFFSVVIPTYNRAALILRTLETVWAQTYPHFEVIVIDNCSEDETQAVLAPHVEARRIRFIKHDQNYERARSRNTGMSVARGDFVTLLDSDDFMYPTNLADAAAYARANPDIKCFHNLYEYVDEEGRVLRRNPVPSLDNQLSAISQQNFMSCIGNFIHREIYQRYSFDTAEWLTGWEDWEFWLRVLADYGVGRIEKVNSGVVQHAGRSVNNQGLENMRLGLEYLCAKLAADEHLSKVYLPYLKRIRASSLLYIAIAANGGGLFGDARKYLVRALNADFSLMVSERFWRAARRAIFKLVPA